MLCKIHFLQRTIYKNECFYYNMFGGMLMTNEEIKKSKERLASLKEGIKELENIRQELLEEPEVQEYVAADSLLRETNDEIEKLNQEIIKGVQENCSHPAWVLFYKDSDPYEGRTYYTCRCVACGKEVTDYARRFPEGRVIYEYSHDIYGKWNFFSKRRDYEDVSAEEKGKHFAKLLNSLRKH